MNIFSLFGNKETNTSVVRSPQNSVSLLTNQKQSYLQRELSGLKEFVRELDHKDRVSKKQRQELMTRVFLTLDLAEKALETKGEWE